MFAETCVLMSEASLSASVSDSWRAGSITDEDSMPLPNEPDVDFF
jgi:hypothetical protein